MIDPVKVIIRIVKFIFIISVCLILLLGIVGGSWGAKQVPKSHPFYTGERLLIAHRGVSDHVPENTVAAATQAISLGFNTIEIDVKQSQDGKFYLFHDRNTERLFGKSFSLDNKTMAELLELPLYHKGQPTHHRVPELESFANQFQGKLMLYLDIKRHGNYQYASLADFVKNFLEKRQLTDRTFVGSDFLFTAYLEYRYPELHTVFTGPGDGSIFIYRWIPQKFRPDFIISYAEEVTTKNVDWLKRNGLINRRMVYGVDERNYGRLRGSEIPILVVEYHPIMDRDLNQ